MKIYAALIVFLLFASTAPAVERPETLADTLALMAQALGQSGSIESVKIDPVENSIEITAKSGITSTVFPDNLHRLLQSLDTAPERDEALAIHIAGLLSSLDFDAQAFSRKDLDKVFPILRNQDLGVDPVEDAFVTPFAGGLGMFYVQDLGPTVNYLTIEGLAQAGVSGGEVEAAAKRNVNQLLPDLTVEGQEVYFLVLDGFYETAFLTMSDYWISVAAQLGPIAMIVPSRDLVAFAPADDAQLVQFLKNTAKTYSNELPWPVSDQVFYWNDEGPWTTSP